MRKRSRIRLADLVEDFGQIAARLTLQESAPSRKTSGRGSGCGRSCCGGFHRSGMPRFCSSNTRPNSLLIGSDISVDTILKPKARLWPARSDAGEHFQSIGQLCAKGFQPALAAHEQPHERQRAHQQPDQRHQRRMDADAPRRRPIPPPPWPPKWPRAAHRQARVGLLEQQSNIAKPFDKCLARCRADRPTAGRGCWPPSPERPWRSMPPTPVNRSRRSSILLAAACRASSIAAPPTNAATPTNITIAISKRTQRLSPPA